MHKHSHNSTSTKAIAMSGIFIALSVLIMMLGGIIPIAVFTAPAFAGLFLIPILIEYGTKMALLSYVATSLLTLFLVPDKEVSLLFIFLLGYYPIVQPFILKIRFKFLQLLSKIIICNISIGIMYFILLTLFSSPSIKSEFSSYSHFFIFLLVVVGNFTFLLYDVLVKKIKFIYIYRIRRYHKK